MSTTQSRRRFIKLIGLGSILPWLPLNTSKAANAASPLHTKTIPSTDETIAAIGMGTWRTFNVGSDHDLRNECTQVLQAFFEAGGSLIDCSPMYGSSAATLGYSLRQLDYPKGMFSAEKVWTSDKSELRSQIHEQAEDWGIARFDLMQVHNLLNWEAHLDSLNELKRDKKIRYLGITTSHGRRHKELEHIMLRHDLDFIQLTYNLTNRDAEQRLLPLAQERGIAVITNRPYDGGTLIKSLKRETKLPQWASRECGCQTWADFLLKFLISHPAITCAIPATSKVQHMQENMEAGRGLLPDPSHRDRMVRFIMDL